jgi:hypothetical protein
MAEFIVEDGSAPEGANSLVSVEYADDYFGENVTWAQVADKEAALITGTRYVMAQYRGQWPGQRTYGRDQALDWPRTGASDAEGEAIDDEDIPVEVMQAVCEAAVREGATAGYLFPDDTGAPVKMQQVGQLKIEYDTSKRHARPVIPAIDSILSGLIVSAGNSATSFLSRA